MATEMRTLTRDADNQVIKAHLDDGDSYATSVLQIKTRSNIKALCEALEDRLAQTATILELDKWEKAKDKRLSNTLVNA